MTTTTETLYTFKGYSISASDEDEARERLAEMIGQEGFRAERSEYNGWANYPTWAVNLWLGNDRPLYNEVLEMARQAVDDAPSDENTQSREGREPIWTVEECARFRLADELKVWVTDDLAPDLGASFAADLLGYALDLVDWDEVAADWITTEIETRP